MQPSDEQLAAAAVSGDLGAYDALMRRCEGLAFKVAYGFTGSRDDALDVVQAAFLKAFRDLARFRGRSAWKTWLLRIVINEGRDWRRRRRRHGERQEPSLRLDERAAPDPGPEADALRREASARLLRRLRSLNRRHSLALALRYFEGLRIPEIAGILGCQEGTVRNMLCRSLRRLRAELGNELEVTP